MMKTTKRTLDDGNRKPPLHTTAYLCMTAGEKLQLETMYQVLTRYMRPLVGAQEFLYDDKVREFSRYYLCFKDGTPSDYANIPEIKVRLQIVKAI